MIHAHDLCHRRLSRPTAKTQSNVVSLPRPHYARQRSRCRAAVLPELQTLLQQAGTAHPGWAAGAAVNCAVFAAGSPVLLKGLTGWGMVNAFILGTAVFAAFGAGGFALVCIYFLFGTAVSALWLKWRYWSWQVLITNHCDQASRSGTASLVRLSLLMLCMPRQLSSSST
jgi:hypothetical protein